jgi:hypothetical protein
MVAITVVKRAHDFERGLAAVRTGSLVHDEVACVTLVPPFIHRNILKAGVLLCQFELFRAPLHGVSSVCRRLFKASDAGRPASASDHS